LGDGKRALEVKKDKPPPKLKWRDLGLGLSKFLLAGTGQREGLAHIWPMKQKERSQGDVLKLFFLEKKHRTSQGESFFSTPVSSIFECSPVRM